MPNATTKKSVLARAARNLAAIGLIAGLSTSVVGCGASSEATAGDNSTQAAEQIATYEEVTVPQDSPLYKLDEAALQQANLAFEPDVVAAGQKLVVDYVITELMDSTALETGDEGYRSWAENEALNYLSQGILDETEIEEARGLVFGNFAGKKSLPNLIKDGGPRLNNATAKVTGYSHVDLIDAPGSAVKYTIEFSGDYRVSDSAAAEFASYYLKNTPEEFLASDKATEAVKDGVGENVHRGYGTTTLTVAFSGAEAYELNDLSDLRIIGYNTKFDFDYSSYTTSLS